MAVSQPTTSLPFALGGPSLTAAFKSVPEDFVVHERLGFEPSGAGEHAFLIVEKRGANTEWVARQLARFAAVGPVAIGFAGLKDRHAVAVQHFTVHLPGRPDPDWRALADPEFRVLAATRHQRKLPRGALAGNRFAIVLREVAGDRAVAESRLAELARRGAPNYFGEQRFGREGGNVEAARAMFAGAPAGRAQRSVLISAARSALFNAVCTARVGDGSWECGRDGDVFQLDGRGSIFGPEPIDDTLRERLARGEVHATGPLWGSGPPPTAAATADLELACAEAEPELARGLERVGLRQERRPLRVMPRNLTFRWDAGERLALEFDLPAGSYATVMLREFARTHEPVR